MNFEDEFLARFQRVRKLSPSFPVQDFAIMCLMARHPERHLTVQQLADGIDASYTNAWNSVRRLQLRGVVIGTRLSEAGRAAMGIDPDWVAPDPLERVAPSTRAPVTPPPVDPDQIF